MIPVLEQGRGCGTSVPRIHVHGHPELPGVQEDFSEVSILKPARASRIQDLAMLNLDKLPAGDTDGNHCLRPSHVLRRKFLTLRDQVTWYPSTRHN
jgi:hypothetical protein